MYGVLLQSVKEAIIKSFGKSIWDQIEQFVDIDLDTILIKKIYPDSIFDEIIKCLMMLRQTGDTEIYMELFGKNFVGHISNLGYDKIVRATGRSFRNFVHSIDQLHESNRFAFPCMQHPLFYVDGEDENGLYLHYQSKRKKFNSYVIGQLKECAKKYFELEIRVIIHKDVSDKEYNHVIFRIEFDNRDFSQSLQKVHRRSKEKLNETGTIKIESLFNMFPFSLGIDMNLEIKYISRVFSTLFGEGLLGQKLNKAFEIVRPKSIKNWDELKSFSHSIVFEISNKINFKDLESSDSSLNFKGQMKYIEDLNIILFVGHPILKNVDDMSKIGLYLNDLNNFDTSAETLVNQIQNQFELDQNSKIHQNWRKNLQTNNMTIRNLKKKNFLLLNETMPYHVAEQIEDGMQPDKICEFIENVTIMFVKTVEFDNYMKSLDPIESVQFLENAFVKYDNIIKNYDKIYKVKNNYYAPYMIVSGLEKENKRRTSNCSLVSETLSLSYTDLRDESVEIKSFIDHNPVERMCAVAIEIIDALSALEIPLNCQIGFHTGNVTTGLVGSELEFCLFGEAINVAKLITSQSQPGQIYFSKESHEFLRDSDKYDFVEVGKLKEDKEINMYRLIGKKHFD